jgi:hypothetical protein
MEPLLLFRPSENIPPPPPPPTHTTSTIPRRRNSTCGGDTIHQAVPVLHTPTQCRQPVSPRHRRSRGRNKDTTTTTTTTTTSDGRRHIVGPVNNDNDDDHDDEWVPPEQQIVGRATNTNTTTINNHNSKQQQQPIKNPRQRRQSCDGYITTSIPTMKQRRRKSTDTYHPNYHDNTEHKIVDVVDTPTVTEDSLRYLFQQSNRFLIQAATATTTSSEDEKNRTCHPTNTLGAVILDEGEESMVEFHKLDSSSSNLKLDSDQHHLQSQENSIHDVQLLSIYLSDTVLKNNASGYCTTAMRDGCHHNHHQSTITATTITTATDITSNNDSNTMLLFGHDSLPLIRK